MLVDHLTHSPEAEQVGVDRAADAEAIARGKAVGLARGGRDRRPVHATSRSVAHGDRHGRHVIKDMLLKVHQQRRPHEDPRGEIPGAEQRAIFEEQRDVFRKVVARGVRRKQVGTGGEEERPPLGKVLRHEVDGGADVGRAGFAHVVVGDVQHALLPARLAAGRKLRVRPRQCPRVMRGPGAQHPPEHLGFLLAVALLKRAADAASLTSPLRREVLVAGLDGRSGPEDVVRVKGRKDEVAVAFVHHADRVAILVVAPSASAQKSPREGRKRSAVALTSMAMDE